MTIKLYTYLTMVELQDLEMTVTDDTYKYDYIFTSFDYFFKY